MPLQSVIAGFLATTLYIPWTHFCVSLLGQRRYLALRSGFTPNGLMRLSMAALVVYPLGCAVISQGVFFISGEGLWSSPELNIRHALGRVVAVMILTLPLVVGWSERSNPHRWRPRWRDTVWLALVFFCLGLSVLVKSIPSLELGAGYLSPEVSPLDEAVILITVLGWCAVNLSATASMGVMSALMMVLFAAAQDTWAIPHWGNLLRFTASIYELAALQLVMMFLTHQLATQGRGGI